MYLFVLPSDALLGVIICKENGRNRLCDMSGWMIVAMIGYSRIQSTRINVLPPGTFWSVAENFLVPDFAAIITIIMPSLLYLLIILDKSE